MTELAPEPDPPDDAELWRRIRADDADAFGLLFARHGPRIHGYVLRRSGDPTVAEDVTAVVFLEAWRRRGSVTLDQPSALPWLYGVAGNVTRRWHRSRRRHHAALARLSSLPPRHPELVEVQAEAAERSRTVLRQIEGLPRRERDVLVLSVWEGLSHHEIALALGIAPGTVKSRLSRARARLDPDAPAPPPLTPPTPLAILETPS
ncbi:MAG TPA: RNA polymerase sigma factor [Iamia sp.]|jgi:RNA polymerase sigma-70 factor (ECF subfamily)|nr:RNA polymerase sigma factor [Iamia sp.]